jgi:hypothetical protein
MKIEAPKGLNERTIDAIHALYNAELPIDSWDTRFVQSLKNHARFSADKPLSEKQYDNLIRLLGKYEKDPYVKRYRELYPA